jgi:hypothetical protein
MAIAPPDAGGLPSGSYEPLNYQLRRHLSHERGEWFYRWSTERRKKCRK